MKKIRTTTEIIDKHITSKIIQGLKSKKNLANLKMADNKKTEKKKQNIVNRNNCIRQ